MTDLTDKWRKGELQEGFYYFKLPNGEIMVGTDDCLATYLFTTHNDRCKVIREVPTFEEWQASEKYNKHLEEVIKIYERKDKQATETSIAYNELAEENTKLKERLKKTQELELEVRKENAQLKERIYEFAEANQSLRKQLDGEKAKNRIDYYDGSPMDFLDECERDRKKNKIYKNLINNIREELIISDLRSTDEGNKFIIGILDKINQALGEDK